MPGKIDQTTIDRIRAMSRNHTKRDVSRTLNVSYRTVLRYTEDIPRPRGQRPRPGKASCFWTSPEP